MVNLITKPTEMNLAILREYISEGDTVVDATAGNGNDTLALAKMAGKTGTVYAFDVQQSAIDHTKILLEKEGFFERCELILGSHHQMRDFLPEEKRGKLAAVVFNLGYLPGGEKEKTTQREITIAAVKLALELIKPGGIVAVTMYGGHPQGAEEKEALLHFAGTLAEKEYHAAYISLINQSGNPPELLLITKKK